jgi:hypothetical protein
MALRLRRWAVVVVLPGLVGCSGAKGHRPSSHAPATGSAVGGASTSASVPPPAAAGGPGWVRSDLRPVSPPYPAGGEFLVYVSTNGGLALTGLNPRTGQTVWQVPASPAAVTPGVSPVLAVLGDLVVFFRPAGGETAELVAAVAHTGVTVWSSRPGVFTGWPGRCVDDPSVVCVTGQVGTSPQAQLLRFTAATGAPLASPTISPDSSGRDLGPDLYDPGDRSPEMLLATSGSAVAWQRPLSGIFTDTGLSTDNGWNFDRVAQVGLFVGSVQGPAVSSTSTQDVENLASTMTAGFRIADGAEVWKDSGTSYVCSILPCPGGAQGNPAVPYTPPTLGLRLRMTGTATSTEPPGGSGAPPTPVLSPGSKVVLEGFNLASGRTTWSFDAGADAALVQLSVPPQVALETVVLPDPSGKPTEVDLTTGAQKPAPPGTTGWCSAITSYKENVPYQAGNGTTISDYTGDFATFACDAYGHPVAAPATIPTFVGAVLGGLVARSEANRVAAAPAAS